MSADEIAHRIGISRTALYRLEKGELVKLETLEKLADLLEISVPTLLGVGIEYIPSAVSYFERLRQIEESTDQIIVMAGPISFLLASDRFEASLEQVLIESIPEEVPNRSKALADVQTLMDILHQRKASYRRRQPNTVNLISGPGIRRFLANGFVGSAGLSESLVQKRKALARAEVEHFVSMIEEEPIGIQIGVVTDTLPHTGFHIFRQLNRKILVISPFRLGEQPNIRVGVAMITSAPDALALHEKMVTEMWRGALKGAAAAQYLRNLLNADEGPRTTLESAPRSTSSRRKT